MSKKTNKYRLSYFEEGDITNSQDEMQRWETLDAQLSALFSIMGNGVLSGWDIFSVEDNPLACAIIAGKGHVGFIAVESTKNQILTLNAKSSNYIYAQLKSTSYWKQDVNFVSFLSPLSNDIENNLYLGVVTTDANGIIDIDTNGRTELGFLSLINSAVASHKHNGATGNPDPVDLSKEVQGILGQEHLPELDASLIQAGTIDTDRFPQIDHIAKLTNQGILTHSQLDSYVETLSLENQSLMGEVSTVNLLQLILALKHVYPDIDEFLVNQIAFIPGISPNDYIDTVNTTATVDTRPYSEGGQHTITGVPSESFKAFTRKWEKNSDFNNGTLNNTIVNGDSVVLNTTEDELLIEDFNNINITGWQVSTHDLSSIGANLTLDYSKYITPRYSAKLTIGSESVEVQLLLQKTFTSQDWSEYDFLNFYIYTSNVQHGDLFFYIRDTVYGEQNSSVKILNRNALTINDDTLVNGWQEVIIDLRQFNRSKIDSMGFYVSTQDGWDTSKGFDFNIDSFSLNAGNIYEQDGYIRLIYGNSIYQNFWRLRWDATYPSDDLSSGISLQARTRVANNLVDLDIAPWSSYSSVSGSDVELPSESLYKYIEIEMYFIAATSLKRSVILNSLYLDYYIVDVENSFEFSTKDDWESGSRFSIDIDSNPGSISIKNTDDFGDIIYGTNGKVNQLDSSLVQKYSVSGSLFPRSTDQVLNNLPSTFGLVTAVARGDSGNIWLIDTDNNRAFEVNKNGDLHMGFQGSFINTPIDKYGVEESGTGSNTDVVEDVATKSKTVAPVVALEALHSLYNPDEGCLYIVFNKDLENIYDTKTKFDISKFYIKVGSHKVWMNAVKAELFGVDEAAYERWYEPSLSKADHFKFLKQFKFTSHILKITLSGSERTTLDYMVNQEQPSIIIYSPMQQERLSGDVTIKFLVYNFDIGSGSGENGIEITLDGNVQTIYNDTITFSGLSQGEHTFKAQLQNGDLSLNTNIEAIAEMTFVIHNGSYSQPYIYFTSPRANQIYSSSPVSIEFNVENFPIIPSGQHLQYQIDSDSFVDHYTTDPILLEELDSGKHSISIWTVDENENELVYTYGRASIDFIIGLNSVAGVKLYIQSDSIADSQGNVLLTKTNLNVDVENVKFINMYSPIDIQMIPSESSVNNDGSPTVLISKLRSQSTTYDLGDDDNLTEMTNRLANDILRTQAVTNKLTEEQIASQLLPLNEIFSDVSTEMLIYEDKYLDGHSVVQLNMNGEVVFSNNAAIFSDTKENAKKILGSAEKIGESELLIGDSINKRAIIVHTDLSTETPKVIWEYESDRNVVDFHLNIQEMREISIYDGSVSSGSMYLKQGMNLIWKNESSIPVSIYSGYTTYDLFNLNPNLNLYGDMFKSPVLQPGESYSFKFNSEGEYPWFVYPSIITGEIKVTEQRLSVQDEYYILESDGLDSPFSSRLIKVDSWGHVVWSFGENYLVKPRDVRPMLNNKVLIST